METYKFKVIVIGDPAVGKTSLIRRFTTGKFRDSYHKTLGVDFTIKSLDFIKENIKVILQIWDIAGDERYNSLREEYYESALGGFLVYDTTRNDTLRNLNGWLNGIRRYCGEVSCIVLGNKADILIGRDVPVERGKAFADDINVPFFETSAKTGENVSTAFKLLANSILRKEYNLQLEV